MSDLIKELSDQIDSVIDGYYAGAIPEIVAPVKAEIERLQYEIEKMRFVIELMPCTCRGLETCLRCELLEASDEVS